MADAPGPDRRGRARRRGHARQQSAARAHLGADPAGLADLGGPLPRARVAGRLGAVRVLRACWSARSSSSPAPATSAACCSGRPGRHPLGADALDDPARRLPRLRRRGPVGDPRAARRARLQRRPIGRALVHRVRRRVPRVGDRRRTLGPVSPPLPGVVHERRCSRSTSPSAARSCSRCWRSSPASAGRPRRAAGGAGEGGEPAAQHPAALDRRAG